MLSYTEFHHESRMRVTSRWRPVASAAVALLGVLVTMFASVIATLVFELGSLPAFALNLAGIGAGVPIALLAVRFIERRPVGTVVSVAGRIRWSWLGQCALLAVGCGVVSLVACMAILPLMGVDVSEGPGARFQGARYFVSSLLLLAPLLLVQVAAEEVISRGVVLQAAGRFSRRSWVAIAVSGGLFAALHGVGSAAGMISALVIGLSLAWIVIRTGGLEAGFAWHAAQNSTALLFGAFYGLPDPTASVAQTSLAGAIFPTCSVLLYVFACRWWVGRQSRRSSDQTDVAAVGASD